MEVELQPLAKTCAVGTPASGRIVVECVYGGIALFSFLAGGRQRDFPSECARLSKAFAIRLETVAMEAPVGVEKLTRPEIFQARRWRKIQIGGLSDQRHEANQRD